MKRHLMILMVALKAEAALAGYGYICAFSTNHPVLTAGYAYAGYNGKVTAALIANGMEVKAIRGPDGDGSNTKEAAEAAQKAVCDRLKAVRGIECTALAPCTEINEAPYF